MKKRMLDYLVFGLCLAWAVIVLPRLFTGRWSPEVESVLTWAGGLMRLAFLAVAAIASTRALWPLDNNNPARTSQAFLAGGFTVYLIAQTTLFVLTIASGGTPPYPSVADLGFFIAMLLLIAGVAVGIRSWLKLGLFHDGGRNAAKAAAVVAVPMVIGITAVLRSLASADLPAAQMAADILYPVLDSILVIVTVAMLRLNLMMGRGTVGAVWRSLLVGFLAMAAGDVSYSFFAGFNLDALDPVIDVLYTVAYALYARGAVLQLMLVRED